MNSVRCVVRNPIFNIPKYKIKTYKIKDENDKIRYIKMKCPIKYLYLQFF